MDSSKGTLGPVIIIQGGGNAEKGVHRIPSKAASSDGKISVSWGPKLPDSAKVPTNGSDRYFILQCRSAEDVRASIRDGSWSTHPSNGFVLNEAFEDSGNVYLVISDSEAGEYFGYARMGSRTAPSRDPDEHSHGRGQACSFDMQWISTNRLPLHRTRGLRNAYDSNREVKFARDGTELEPGSGRRLCQMFHQARPVCPAHGVGRGRENAAAPAD